MLAPTPASPLPADAPRDAHPDALFDADWLALRAAADSAARAAHLNLRAADWLRARRPAADDEHPFMLADLGSGSGANPRYLAPRLPGPQHWTLIDHDPALLDRARSSCAELHDYDGGHVRIETRQLDLAAPSGMALGETDLVCASALLDLVDTSWLARLAELCAELRCAVLVTLSVDGQWRFEGPGEVAGDADDALVREAFNAHQRRDKGLGAALGPDAAPALAAALDARGFELELAPSPWELNLAEAGDAALARALIDGWRDAARAQCPQAAARIEAWHGRRSALCGASPGRLVVGHVDLFAAPRTHPVRNAG
ncbi:methyltransferase domain-containing protein [Thauera sp. WH-1]|uniref:methyltransferase domain-containing protein n=1 Tax=Thauera sp. WH-1 TaxID=3398230 RepID=UPI0039FBEFB7